MFYATFTICLAILLNKLIALLPNDTFTILAALGGSIFCIWGIIKFK